MKIAKAGDYLLWEGELAIVIGEINKHAVCIEMIKGKICPHCGEKIGREVITVIDSSPQFQQSAEPIQTIES